MATIVEYGARELLNKALAVAVAQELKFLLNEFGEAFLMVSGGSTPGSMYEILSAKAIDWTKVKVTLVDERWVNLESEFSNEKLIREKLLCHHAFAADFSGLVFDASDSTKNLSFIRKKYKDLPLQKTVVILGMGTDGHFASIFPNDEFSSRGLQENSPDLIVTISPVEPRDRISWSLRAISQSPFVFLMMTGEKKKQIVLSRRKEKLPIDYLIEAIPHLKIMYSE